MAHRSKLSDEKAARILVGLRDGKTPRLVGTTADCLKSYCAAHPEYGREALPLLDANVKAAFLRKGAHLRDRPTCKYGHSLEGARTYVKDGYKFRFCVECRKVDDAKGGILKPELAAKIKAALMSPTATISSITHTGPRRLVSPVSLQAYRRADPEIDLLVKGIISTVGSRSSRYQKLRWQRLKKQNEANDYHKIMAMLPAAFPDKDDVVSDIFEALANGSLRREDVRSRVRQFVTAHILLKRYFHFACGRPRAPAHGHDDFASAKLIAGQQIAGGDFLSIRLHRSPSSELGPADAIAGRAERGNGDHGDRPAVALAPRAEHLGQERPVIALG
jgi:hypothetical protein